LVLPVTELIATAPAPAIATPAVPPIPTASAGGGGDTLIVARETTIWPVTGSLRRS
jgi:hypothetical protein